MSDEVRWFEFYDIIFLGQDPAQRPLTPSSISIPSYRGTFLGPSNQRKKRKLERELKDLGVTDPGFRRTLATEAQDCQFQELQEFIKANDDPSIPVDCESNMSQLDPDDPWEFDFSQVSQQTASTRLSGRLLANVLNCYWIPA
ncbi:hypothetical protein FAGAP_10156 [Fusarium agapanthi]|uniref:Uncharacterized protein n=1 Tax=Fusarium agapanthi TaxID=1803897 RepID=A0A9P5B133_9HYPO|nr:hypothetical protein FAGAP_10156 [Fusarium agapanthi]